jgi:hypothetical protein
VDGVLAGAGFPPPAQNESLKGGLFLKRVFIYYPLLSFVTLKPSTGKHNPPSVFSQFEYRRESKGSSDSPITLQKSLEVLG